MIISLVGFVTSIVGTCLRSKTLLLIATCIAFASLGMVAHALLSIFLV